MWPASTWQQKFSFGTGTWSVLYQTNCLCLAYLSNCAENHSIKHVSALPVNSEHCLGSVGRSLSSIEWTCRLDLLFAWYVVWTPVQMIEQSTKGPRPHGQWFRLLKITNPLGWQPSPALSKTFPALGCFASERSSVRKVLDLGVNSISFHPKVGSKGGLKEPARIACHGVGTLFNCRKPTI